MASTSTATQTPKNLPAAIFTNSDAQRAWLRSDQTPIEDKIEYLLALMAQNVSDAKLAQAVRALPRAVDDQIHHHLTADRASEQNDLLWFMTLITRIDILAQLTPDSGQLRDATFNVRTALGDSDALHARTIYKFLTDGEEALRILQSPDAVFKRFVADPDNDELLVAFRPLKTPDGTNGHRYKMMTLYRSNFTISEIESPLSLERLREHQWETSANVDGAYNTDGSQWGEYIVNTRDLPARIVSGDPIFNKMYVPEFRHEGEPLHFIVK